MRSTPVPLTSDGGTGPQDLLLVQRALRRDKAAVDEVLGRLSCVVRFVYRLNKTLGYGLVAESLEDVVQQVYTSVWPKLSDFAGSAALESWVYGFCRNCLRAETRRRRYQNRVISVDDEELDQRAQANDELAPAETLYRSEGVDALREEISRLKTVEREAVRLRHLEGWSFEAIARHLGLPASTIKDRCYRALLKMKGRLKSRDVSA